MEKKLYTVSDLAGMTFDDTVHPRAFYLEVAVDDWADLDRKLVACLAREGRLTKDKLPIHNHARRGKYFINKLPMHRRPDFDGDWHKVGGIYVDTKYNASAHIKNILAMLEQLNFHDPHYYFAFRIDDNNAH